MACPGGATGVNQAGALPPLPDSWVGLQLAYYTATDITSGQGMLKSLALGMAPVVASYTNNYVVGHTSFDIFSIPTTLDGTAYTASVSVTSAAGTLTPVRKLRLIEILAGPEAAAALYEQENGWG